MMRRDFIAMAGAALSLQNLPARAQTGDMPVIGFLHSASPEPFAHLAAAFRQGLEKMGYVEGRNVAIEYRWAGGQYENLTAMAQELAARNVAVLVTAGGEMPAFAAKNVTSTIPILTVMGRDLVAAGLVDSLSRPSGNLTGVMQFTTEMMPIRLGLLHDLVPDTNTISLLVNAQNPNSQPQMREAEAAARKIGLDLNVLLVRVENDLTAVFAALDNAAPRALLVGAEPVLFNRRVDLVAGIARRAIPAVYDFREFAEAGGLLSYGSSLAGLLPADRHLCRPTLARRQAGRSAGGALREIRIRGQSPHRPRAGPDDAAIYSAAR